MTKRKLGRSGLEVAPLAFGGNVFGWTVDEAASFHLLDAFVASGFNLIDTADMHSRWAPGNKGGESETILDNWLKRTGNRGKVLIATKVLDARINEAQEDPCDKPNIYRKTTETPQ